jgi:hypothetical protein
MMNWQEFTTNDNVTIGILEIPKVFGLEGLDLELQGMAYRDKTSWFLCFPEGVASTLGLGRLVVVAWHRAFESAACLDALFRRPVVVAKKCKTCRFCSMQARRRQVRGS